MNVEDKDSVFLKAVKNGMQKWLNDRGSKELSDRTQYIGASDIASCPRKATIEKFMTSQKAPETNGKFMRGHIAEDMIAEMISTAGYKFERGRTLKHPDVDYITVHPDFIIHNKDFSSIKIVEVKSTTMPKEPYSTWISQLHLQMGIAKLYYPNATIDGSILAVDVSSGELKEFNGFTPNDIVFQSLIEKAKYMWEIYNKITEQGSEEELDIKTEVSHLCAYCPVKKSCPHFSGDEVPDEVKGKINRYITLQSASKELDTEIKAIRDEMVNLYPETTLNFDGIKVSIYTVNRSTLDTAKIKAEKPDVYQAYLKTSSAMTFKVS